MLLTTIQDVDNAVFKLTNESRAVHFNSDCFDKLQFFAEEKTMPVLQTTPTVAPSVISPLQDFITQEGDRAQFCCKIAGKGK